MIRNTDVGKNDGEDFFIHHPGLEEFDRRQSESLLLHFGGIGGKTAGDGPSGVRPVTGVGKPGKEFSLVEERLDETDIHQVGAAQVRIIDNEEIAIFQVFGPFDDTLCTELHGADKHRKPQFPLGNQFPAVLFVNPVRTVQGLGNDRTESGADKGQVHLIADLLQSALNDSEGDRVKSGHMGF